MKALLDAGADPNVRLEAPPLVHLLQPQRPRSRHLGRHALLARGLRHRRRRDAAAGGLRSRLHHARRSARRGVPRPATAATTARPKPDPSGLPVVPIGGPGVQPIHAASGVGYGLGLAGNAHRHAPNGWLPSVRYLVEELGANVNARDYNGFSPLHNAAARGDRELIEYLVERGRGRHRAHPQGRDHRRHGERSGSARHRLPGDRGAAGAAWLEKQRQLRVLLTAREVFARGTIEERRKTMRMFVGAAAVLVAALVIWRGPTRATSLSVPVPGSPSRRWPRPCGSRSSIFRRTAGSSGLQVGRGRAPTTSGRCPRREASPPASPTMAGREMAPRFSPDGRWIAFEADFGGTDVRDLYVVPSGGGEPTAPYASTR